MPKKSENKRKEKYWKSKKREKNKGMRNEGGKMKMDDKNVEGCEG